jgi:hypothetical protein
MVNPTVNQQALGLMVNELLPEGVRVVKEPSLFVDKREVHIQTEGEGDLQTLEQEYLHTTGFKLKIKGQNDSNQQDFPQIAIPSDASTKMEINIAYAHIKHTLEPYGLYRTSLKQGQIVLSFISPQVGERHLPTIQQLSTETGYSISIHPNPNQQEILRVVQQLLREAGWQVRKGPSIYADRGEVAVTLTHTPESEDLIKIAVRFEDETGYRLSIS